MINIARLDALIEQRNMNLTDLAREAQISYDTLYAIRSGRRPNTSTAIARKLATALAVPVDELLEGDGVAVDSLPRALHQLTGIVAELSESRQEELVKIAGALKRQEEEESHLLFSPAQMRALMRSLADLTPAELEEWSRLIEMARTQDRPLGAIDGDMPPAGAHDAPQHGAQDETKS